jgi:hypothetical protein
MHANEDFSGAGRGPRRLLFIMEHVQPSIVMDMNSLHVSKSPLYLKMNKKTYIILADNKRTIRELLTVPDRQILTLGDLTTGTGSWNLPAIE